jgi:hypothetical protein
MYLREDTAASRFATRPERLPGFLPGWRHACYTITLQNLA